MNTDEIHSNILLQVLEKIRNNWRIAYPMTLLGVVLRKYRIICTIKIPKNSFEFVSRKILNWIAFNHLHKAIEDEYMIFVEKV